MRYSDLWQKMQICYFFAHAVLCVVCWEREFQVVEVIDRAAKLNSLHTSCMRIRKCLHARHRWRLFDVLDSEIEADPSEVIEKHFRVKNTYMKLMALTFYYTSYRDRAFAGLRPFLLWSKPMSCCSHRLSPSHDSHSRQQVEHCRYRHFDSDTSCGYLSTSLSNSHTFFPPLCSR